VQFKALPTDLQGVKCYAFSYTRISYTRTRIRVRPARPNHAGVIATRLPPAGAACTARAATAGGPTRARWANVSLLLVMTDLDASTLDPLSCGFLAISERVSPLVSLSTRPVWTVTPKRVTATSRA